MTSELTISQTVQAYLDYLPATSASTHTHNTYQDALDLFLETLPIRSIEQDAALPEQSVAWVLSGPVQPPGGCPRAIQSPPKMSLTRDGNLDILRDDYYNQDYYNNLFHWSASWKQSSSGDPVN